MDGWLDYFIFHHKDEDNMTKINNLLDNIELNLSIIETSLNIKEKVMFQRGTEEEQKLADKFLNTNLGFKEFLYELSRKEFYMVYSGLRMYKMGHHNRAACILAWKEVERELNE